MFRAITGLLVLVLLGGCGFQLQGAFTTPPEMQRTYVSAVDPYSPFYRALKKQMHDSGLQLVDSAAEASATLDISFDETSQRVLSVSARNVPTEYEVYYTIEYALNAGPKKMLEAQTLTVTRDYTYDSTLVLGKAREEELLREAIVEDLVRIVMKQISAL